MSKKERMSRVLQYLGPRFGVVETELQYETPFQLLVATVLSAQCTDKRVNSVTPALFSAYPDARAMATASEEDIFPYISSVSYPNSKARHLSLLSRMIMEEYDGNVPQTLETLTRLPGVGRKTANVVLAVAFGQVALAVDTHVFRVAHRLGFVPASANTPYKVELALRQLIPDKDVAHAHFWLLLHGRYTCTSQRPKCTDCGLREFCVGPLAVKAK
ncbi:MAG: endonuclease III [Alloprevotella sp.]|nr:endonuclease III [Alloprevotella sp.]